VNFDVPSQITDPASVSHPLPLSIRGPRTARLEHAGHRRESPAPSRPSTPLTTLPPRLNIWTICPDLRDQRREIGRVRDIPDTVSLSTSGASRFPREFWPVGSGNTFTSHARRCGSGRRSTATIRSNCPPPPARADATAARSGCPDASGRSFASTSSTILGLPVAE